MNALSSYLRLTIHREGQIFRQEFEKGLAKRKNVLIGNSYKDKIEIISGLKEDDVIVTRGNENLRNNQRVKIKKNKH